MRQVLEDKEKEVNDTKDWLCQAKEEAIREYCDFNTLLAELRALHDNRFDDCLRQVKATFPNLDLSNVNIDTQAQTSVQPIHSESMDELFADDALVDNPSGDREKAPVKSQIKLVEEGTRHPDEVLAVEEKNEDTPVQH